MSYRHQAKRRDANEAAIIEALRGAGASVQQLNERGAPDLLVGFRGTTYLLEVKNPEAKGGAKPGGVRRKGGGYLTDDQLKWFGAWKGGLIYEVDSVGLALATIGAVPCLPSVPREVSL